MHSTKPFFDRETTKKKYQNYEKDEVVKTTGSMV
jgi:hypothetical protein